MGHRLGTPVTYQPSKPPTCLLASQGKSEARDWRWGLLGALGMGSGTLELSLRAQIPSSAPALLQRPGPGPEGWVRRHVGRERVQARPPGAGVPELGQVWLFPHHPSLGCRRLINKTNNYLVIADCRPGAGTTAEGKHLGSRVASGEDSPACGVGQVRGPRDENYGGCQAEWL